MDKCKVKVSIKVKVLLRGTYRIGHPHGPPTQSHQFKENENFSFPAKWGLKHGMDRQYMVVACVFSSSHKGFTLFSSMFQD